ncbi:MAG: helix-turn-helix transcriptional regulator [Actinobacteria bacterium]|nr:helix-turn-helix transcriptional regulator [Actinomycetota bacterium]MBU1607815.1 helix-turn-helix transcriptional regulator [Actinomycetota bacterium]MBU2314669.1 helix-turn-helix transcriptional regulator [Actinomycetota bacterium]MBU2385630.1 helix-turn-helix transcriptional regulator [Actinomycetota bacterium]
MPQEPELPRDSSFATSLKKTRERLGLSQGALAELMQARGYKFHQATIYKVESGARRVSVGEAAALAEVLDVPLTSMLIAKDPAGDVERALHFIQSVIESHQEIREGIAGLQDEKRLTELVESIERAGVATDLPEGVSVIELSRAVSGLDVSELEKQLDRIQHAKNYRAAARVLGIDLED